MSKASKFQAPTGMHDILPEDQRYFQKIYDTAEKIVDFYGFQKIETPILENTDLFVRGTGLTTDIVQKQMYSLKTKGGDSLTLRPEFTPGIVRAYIENGMQNLPQPQKLCSTGPLFRYESPQAGRFRQFHQFNLEVIGEESSVVDAQIIQIFYNILSELKIKNLVVEINSIGDSQCRPYYKKLLVNYFKSREASLCGDCRRRMRENPLRVLDCKEEKCQPVKAHAPQMVDHLCEVCHKHFKEVLEFLDEIGLPYHLNPYLVRGLDYYTKTVFEFFANYPPRKKEQKEEEPIKEGEPIGEEQKKEEPAKEESAQEPLRQIALGGGGRYDLLIKLLTGRDIPAAGGALGIERVIQLMKENNIKVSQDKKQPHIFLAQLGNMAKRKSLKLMEDFRTENILVAESFGRDSLKAQLVRANKLGVKYALILGQQEALDEAIIVRDMESGKQETVKLNKTVDWMRKKLKK